MSLTGRVRDFAHWRGRRIANVWTGLKRGFKGAAASRKFDAVDPQVHYPSYKSMDDFVDVERLRTLDDVVTKGVQRVLGRGEGIAFDTGPLRKNPLRPMRPGSTVIELSTANRPFSYFDLAHTDAWEPTPHAEQFPELMDFIDTLPFQATSRMIIMCDDKGRAIPEHRDHARSEILHEFIWFRTNLDKPFYVTDRDKRERRYIDSHSAWFDTVNQFHGGDSVDRSTISIRVDGTFTDELRAKIPEPPRNAASTPSFWASTQP